MNKTADIHSVEIDGIRYDNVEVTEKLDEFLNPGSGDYVYEIIFPERPNEPEYFHIEDVKILD